MWVWRPQYKRIPWLSTSSEEASSGAAYGGMLVRASLSTQLGLAHGMHKRHSLALRDQPCSDFFGMDGRIRHSPLLLETIALVEINNMQQRF